MGDVVNLHGQSLIENDAFVTDMARFAEGSGLSEEQLRKKSRFITDEVWSSLGDDDALAPD